LQHHHVGIDHAPNAAAEEHFSGVGLISLIGFHPRKRQDRRDCSLIAMDLSPFDFIPRPLRMAG
jgi:hypothetical protein